MILPLSPLLWIFPTDRYQKGLTWLSTGCQEPSHDDDYTPGSQNIKQTWTEDKDRSFGQGQTT